MPSLQGRLPDPAAGRNHRDLPALRGRSAPGKLCDKRQPGRRPATRGDSPGARRNRCRHPSRISGRPDARLPFSRCSRVGVARRDLLPALRAGHADGSRDRAPQPSAPGRRAKWTAPRPVGTPATRYSGPTRGPATFERRHSSSPTRLVASSDHVTRSIRVRHDRRVRGIAPGSPGLAWA